MTLLFSLGQAPTAQARTLEEHRTGLVEGLMQGITQTFTYEEVDDYLQSEEENVLATGTIRALSTYGIDGNHSTAQGISVADYLQNYLDSHATEEDLAVLYPYQVDFESLQETLIFHEVGGEEMQMFTLSKDGDSFNLFETVWDADRSHAKEFIEYSGGISNKENTALRVKTFDGLNRTIEANSHMVIQTISAHRNDYIFYFFQNKSGGLSLLKWDIEDPEAVLFEYATKETIDELSKEPAMSSTTDWALPHDWRMLSPRLGDVPPVTWVMLSEGDGRSIAIEPVFAGDGIVSGFIPPNYWVEVDIGDVMQNIIHRTLTAYPNESGYFSIDAEATVGMPPSIRVFNEQGQVVFQTDLGIVQYYPTALAHESGYLTLERYFVGQGYVEGYTYPNATVNFWPLNGYATVASPPIQADSNGYFFKETARHINNLTTTIVSVEHPETGETISVAPYPWTQWELDNAVW